jgi:Ca2+-binding RTX toxin-like protein
MSSTIPGEIGPDTPLLQVGDSYTEEVFGVGDNKDVDIFRLDLTPEQVFRVSLESSEKNKLDVDIINADGDIVTRPTWHYYGRNYREEATFTIAIGSGDEDLFVRLQSTKPNQTKYHDLTMETVSAPRFTNGDDLFELTPESHTYETILGGKGVDTLSFRALSNPVTLDLAQSTLTFDNADGEEVTIRVQAIERFEGTEGNDLLFGGHAFFGWNDVFVPSNVPEVSWYGHGGDDRLGSTEGATLFDGGPGIDTADYSDVARSSGGVNASLLRGRAWGDGAAAGDRFRDIENLTGTFFDDTLTGDHGDNRLDGLRGNDLLIGLGGDDTLTGYSEETYALQPSTAWYSGPRSDYTITKSVDEDGIMILFVEHLGGSGWEGRDTLRKITTLQFADGLVQVDDLPDDHGDGITAPATRIAVGDRVSVLADKDQQKRPYDDPNAAPPEVDRLEVELEAGKHYVVHLERKLYAVEAFGAGGISERYSNQTRGSLDVTAPDGSLIYSAADNDSGDRSTGSISYSVRDQNPLVDFGMFKPFVVSPTETGVYAIDIGNRGRHGPVTGGMLSVQEIAPSDRGTPGDDALIWDQQDVLLDAGLGTDHFGFPLDQSTGVTAFAGSAYDLLLRNQVGEHRHVEGSSFTTLRNFESLSLTDADDTVDLRLPRSENNPFGSFSQPSLSVLDGKDGTDTLLLGELYTRPDDLSELPRDEGVLVDLNSERMVGVFNQEATIRNFENVTGTTGNDTLIGDDGNNRLNGVSGADEIHGGAGDDHITANYDAVTVYPGAGADTVSVPEGSRIIFDGGIEEHRFSGSDSTIDIYEPDNAGNRVSLRGPSGPSIPSEIHFDDAQLQVLMPGNPSVSGHAGRDWISVSRRDARATGGQGDDFLVGTFNDQTAVYRYRLEQYQISFSTYDLGFEQDRISLLNASGGTQALRVDYVGPWTGDGTDEIIKFNHLEFRNATVDIHHGVEQERVNDELQFQGSNYAEIYVGSGALLDNVRGMGGDDTMDGGLSLSDRALYRGDRADYDITMDVGRITVSDQVARRDGTDVLTRFNELVFRDSVVEIRYLTEEETEFTGSLGDDIVLANRGDDSVTGKHGNDTIDGGAGHDTSIYNYGRAQYDIRAEDGRVIVDYIGPWFGDGTDVLTNVETLAFRNATVPILQGSAEDDALFGSWREEVFLGGDGDDRFKGGYGNDLIEGGAGNDTALYRYRYADYSIRRLGDGDLEVAYTGRWHGDGIDRLSGVEQLDFVDRTILVDDLAF